MYEIIRVDPEVTCYFVRWSEIPTEQTYRRFLEDLKAHPDIVAGYHSMNDMRSVDMNVTSGTLRGLVETRTQVSGIGEGRRALLVASDLGFGMMRMYAMLTEKIPGQFRAFRNAREAASWLGLPEDYPLPF